MLKISLIVDYTSKKYRISKGTVETIIIFCPLCMEISNPLFRNFNNITKWLNLFQVDLSNNGISNLPIAFGTLPFLKRLHLSRNRFGISYQNEWLWMMQSIKNTLLHLDLSYNLITGLPCYIAKLDLKILDISHNMLMYLPHTIGQMQSLKVLDVSCNSLIYLPMEIFNLKLNVLFLSNNLCITHRDNHVKYMFFPKLIELSAAIIKRHRIKYENIPQTLVEYLDNMRRCYYCKQYCKTRCVYIIDTFSLYVLSDYTLIQTTNRKALVRVQQIRCFQCRNK